MRGRHEAERARELAQHLQAATVHPCVRGDSGSARRNNRPSGKTPRYFLHIFLRIPAIDAQRVQLHQLARVIFIDAAALLLLLRSLILWVVSHGNGVSTPQELLQWAGARPLL